MQSASLRAGTMTESRQGVVSIGVRMRSALMDSYYRDVMMGRYKRVWILASMLCVALAGCDRGNHPAQTGMVAPDFTVSDGTTRVHLGDYRGQVVLLNFWASWCAPCVAEIPSLEQLHHADPKLVILAVSVDDDQSAYREFVKEHQMDLTTVWDPKETAAARYHSEMWPETYAIDRQGRIRRKFVGATDWMSPEVVDYLKMLER